MRRVAEAMTSPRGIGGGGQSSKKTGDGVGADEDLLVAALALELEVRHAADGGDAADDHAGEERVRRGAGGVDGQRVRAEQLLELPELLEVLSLLLDRHGGMAASARIA